MFGVRAAEDSLFRVWGHRDGRGKEKRHLQIQPQAQPWTDHRLIIPPIRNYAHGLWNAGLSLRRAWWTGKIVPQTRHRLLPKLEIQSESTRYLLQAKGQVRQHMLQTKGLPVQNKLQVRVGRQAATHQDHSAPSVFLLPPNRFPSVGQHQGITPRGP